MGSTPSHSRHSLQLPQPLGGFNNFFLQKVTRRLNAGSFRKWPTSER